MVPIQDGAPAITAVVEGTPFTNDRSSNDHARPFAWGLIFASAYTHRQDTHIQIIEGKSLFAVAKLYRIRKATASSTRWAKATSSSQGVWALL